MSVASFIAAQRSNHGVPHVIACRALGVRVVVLQVAGASPQAPGGAPQRARRRRPTSFEGSDRTSARAGCSPTCGSGAWKVSKKSAIELFRPPKYPIRSTETEPGQGMANKRRSDPSAPVLGLDELLAKFGPAPQHESVPPPVRSRAHRRRR